MPTKPTPQVKQSARAFLEKAVINAGVGHASSQGNFDKVLPQITRDLSLLAGQKPQTRQARRSIAGFKIREGQIVGLKITLRGRRLVDFFERLTKIVLPRVRDFRGVDEKCIDEGGALHIGFKEHLVFPEINPEDSPTIFPLGVTLVPRRRNRALALESYKKLGIPFKKENNK